MYQFNTSNSLPDSLAIYRHISRQSSCVEELAPEGRYLSAQSHAGLGVPANSRWSRYSGSGPYRVWQDRGCSTSGAGLVAKGREGGDKSGLHHPPARFEQGHDRPRSTSRRHYETYGRRTTRGHTLIGTAQAGRDPTRYLDYHSRDAPSNSPRKVDAASSESGSVRNHRRSPPICA